MIQLERLLQQRHPVKVVAPEPLFDHAERYGNAGGRVSGCERRRACVVRRGSDADVRFGHEQEALALQLWIRLHRCLETGRECGG